MASTNEAIRALPEPWQSRYLELAGAWRRARGHDAPSLGVLAAWGADVFDPTPEQGRAFLAGWNERPWPHVDERPVAGLLTSPDAS